MIKHSITKNGKPVEIKPCEQLAQLLTQWIFTGDLNAGGGIAQHQGRRYLLSFSIRLLTSNYTLHYFIGLLMQQ